MLLLRHASAGYMFGKLVSSRCLKPQFRHYNDVIMGAIASQITSLTIVYSTVYSDAGQRKHQSSASLAFVRGIHWGPVNSPHKWPVTLKMSPFDDVIMSTPSHLNMPAFRVLQRESVYSNCNFADIFTFNINSLKCLCNSLADKFFSYPFMN